MNKFLIYNFSGELDDLSHLFPNERLASACSAVLKLDKPAEIWDRGNIDELIRWGSRDIAELGSLNFDDQTGNYLIHLREEARQILDRGFSTVFLNLWQGSGYKFTMDLSKILKELDPGLRIYGIGQKVDWLRENILEFSPCLDGLILGLEHKALSLLARGKDPADIPNMILKGNGKKTRSAPERIEMNVLPVYDPGVYQGIEGKFPLYMISLSNQACPGKCVFCVRPVNYGSENLARNISDVMAEIRYLVNDRKARCFRFSDSTPPAGALTRVAQALLDERINQGNLIFTAFSRIDLNREENFKLLKEAGISALFFGIESLDDGVLSGLKKGITFESIRTTLKKAHDAGIYTIGSFIFPVPGETEKSMKTTLERIGVLKPCLDSVLVRPAGVYPESEWGRHPEKYGIRLSPDYIKETMIYPIKQMLPLRGNPPFPFTYPVMGKSAESVSYEDIISLFEDFTELIRKKIGIPGVPDYYWSSAKAMKEDVNRFTGSILKSMVERDYPAIKKDIERMKTRV